MFVILIIFLAVLFYSWVFYPLVIILAGRIVGQNKDEKRKYELFTDSDLPAVAVIISAYNEEAHIRGRIVNILESEYPHDKISIWIGVDAASDNTSEIVKKAFSNDKRVHVVDFPERCGKTAVLKNLIKMADTEIFVFTDANTFFCKDTIKRLVMPLKDSRVGGVCGRLIFKRAGKQDVMEEVYWDFETSMKRAESILDSCLGANGAIYAVKKEFFWEEIPDNTIVDDFVIGMKVREAGRKIIFEPSAIAYEDLPERLWEWERRVRIGAGDFQALHLCWKCLLPRYGIFAWMFLSHKVIRWITPLLGVVVFIVAVGDFFTVGINRSWHNMPISLWVLIITGTVFLTTILTRGSRYGIAGTFGHFVLMQLAIVVGFWRYCRGNLKGYWERTPRGAISNE